MKITVSLCLLLALALISNTATADTRYYLLRIANMNVFVNDDKHIYLKLELGERDSNNVTRIIGRQYIKLLVDGQYHMVDNGAVTGRIAGSDITLNLSVPDYFNSFTIKARYVDRQLDLLEGKWHDNGCFHYLTGPVTGTAIDPF